MNETKTYDLRVNSSGSAQPMAHGFFKHIAEMLSAPSKPYIYEEHCELVGVYWVEKALLDPKNTSYTAKTIRAYLDKAQRKTSAAQLKAGAKYDAEHTKQVMLKLNKTTDADILAALDACGNVQGYIKGLIRADLAKTAAAAAEKTAD